MQPFDRKCTKISRPSFIVSSMYHERVPKHAKAGLCNNSSSMNFQVSCLHLFLIGLCLVHVIWTKHRMLKLVLNVKYLLLVSFLTAAEFYNLGYIQERSCLFELLSDLIFMLAEKMKTKIQH